MLGYSFGMPDSQNGTAATEPNTKPKTSEEFLTVAALFMEVNVDDFRPPAKISFDCPGACCKETTWEKLHDPAPLGSRGEESIQIPDGALKSVAYRCSLCGKEKLTVVYRELEYFEKEVSVLSPSGAGRNFMPLPPSGNRLDRMSESQTRKVKMLVKVTKVGQYPAPVVYLPPGLQKSLGKDATKLYRKALLSRHTGYGLAAVGYMRRVVEDKTNELIEVAAKYAESNNSAADVIASIRAAVHPGKYTPYEEKLKIAATVFPDSLKVDGINPLQVLFGEVSKGLHGFTEEQCIETADSIRVVFEYVFERLKARVDTQQEFADRLKKLVNKSSEIGN